MIYSLEVTTPANTTKAAPRRTTMRLTRGLIYFYELWLPPGSAGLCGVAVLHSGYQMFPATDGQFITGDNIHLPYDDLYMLEAAPYELTIITYNLDDTYEHLIRFAAGLASKEEYQARFLPNMATDQLTSVLATIQGQQSAVRETTVKAAIETLGKRGR